jgi:hypothetical protein
LRICNARPVEALARRQFPPCRRGGGGAAPLGPGDWRRPRPSTDTKDEQQAFQLLVARLVAEGGVHGLAARWRDLPSPQCREMLVSEIGQAFHLWVEEGTIELLLAALDDPDDKVARRAVKLLTSCLRTPPAKERKESAKTLRGRAALEAWDQATAWMTPARRARVAKAVTAALDRCADNPKALTWPDDYIKLLGHSATRTDQRAIALLEAFCKMAGETRRSEFDALAPENLPPPTSILAEKKGVPPGTPFVRAWSIPHRPPRPQGAGGRHRAHSKPRGLTGRGPAAVSFTDGSTKDVGGGNATC